MNTNFALIRSLASLTVSVIHPLLKMVVPALECVITAFVVSVLSANTTQPYLTSQIRANTHAQHANTPRQMKVTVYLLTKLVGEFALCSKSDS